MKFKDKWLEILGVFLIFSFCFVSILFSLIEREIINPETKELISYASFFENRFYDYRSEKVRNFTEVNNDAVLVKIDDETLQKIGSWPLPRTIWVRLLDKLKAFNAKVVAFDVMFPEKSLSCGENSVDLQFKEAIERFQTTGHVILAYTTQAHKSSDVYQEIPENLFDFVMDSKQSGSIDLTKRYVEKSTYPIEELLAATPKLGYINMLEDSDGVFRNYQIVSNLDSLYVPSIGVLAYELLSGNSGKLDINSAGVATYQYKDKLSIHINNNGETKVRWFGSIQNFGDAALWEVLQAADNDKKFKKLFENKIVFIGSTATGAHDLRNTPIDPKMPGVYTHMNMVHMLSADFKYKSIDESVKYTLIILLIAMSLLLIVMYQGNAIYDIIALLAIAYGIYFIDMNYFLPNGYELKLFFTLLPIVLSYSWLTFSNFNKSNKEKKQIKGAFSRYVAPSIVNDMLSNPDKLKVGGDRKDITCLFSDVRDFTAISEKLSANELAKCLNYYMGKMTDIVFETEGTLDKYIGDAIVAFWGAPLEINDHVNQALEASVKMLDILPDINKELTSQGYPEFKIGLGLNSGECNVGNMGSDTIFAYTALGDNMNLGARLESLCKHYGAQILVSEFTYAKMDKERFKARLIDKVKVKGKEKGVEVYEVLYSYHHLMLDQYSYDNFNKAYKLYESRDFEEALALLNKVLEVHPHDVPSGYIKERCENFIKNPPSETEDHTMITMTKK